MSKKIRGTVLIIAMNCFGCSGFARITSLRMKDNMSLSAAVASGAKLIIILFFVTLLQNGFVYGADEVDLPFWAGKGAKTDKRVLTIKPHCCCTGDIAIARLSRLPLPGEKDPLEPELVLELDESGEVLRRWPLPVDTRILAIDGDQILVPIAPRSGSNSAVAIFISSQGEILKTVMPNNLTEPVIYKCPSLPEFGKSAYVRCWMFRDLSNGKIRRLAYQGPCS